MILYFVTKLMVIQNISLDKIQNLKSRKRPETRKLQQKI